MGESIVGGSTLEESRKAALRESPNFYVPPMY